MQDAQHRFQGSPLSQMASQLEKEVVVSSVFGTNSIEGGEFTEDETAWVLELQPEEVQEIQQRRAVNMRRVFELAQRAVTEPDRTLNLDFVLTTHALIMDRVENESQRLGRLRDNPKHIVTRVGGADHGGVYKPLRYGGDVERLLRTLIDWRNRMARVGIPALLRAPLVHYYSKLVHPFRDGNGRVGRVLEVTLLLAADFQYASFA